MQLALERRRRPRFAQRRQGSGHEEGVDGEVHAIQGLPLPAAAHPQGLARPGVHGRTALVGFAGNADCAFSPAGRHPVLEDFPWITLAQLLGLIEPGIETRCLPSYENTTARRARSKPVKSHAQVPSQEELEGQQQELLTMHVFRRGLGFGHKGVPQALGCLGAFRMARIKAELFSARGSSEDHMFLHPHPPAQRSPHQNPPPNPERALGYSGNWATRRLQAPLTLGTPPCKYLVTG